MLGKVKWFNNEKGYGFIQYKDNDVLVHYSVILEEGYKSLIPEEIVEFELVSTGSGYRAKNVKTIKEL